MPAKRAQGGPTDGRPVIVGNGDPELLVLSSTATTCTGAANCSARLGRWKRATDLGGNATTMTTDDGGMWNRACLATGCPVRTYI